MPFLLAITWLSIGLTMGLVEVLLRTVPGLMPERVSAASARSSGVAHPYIGHLHTPNS